jgi:chromosome segregation ATPase
LARVSSIKIGSLFEDDTSETASGTHDPSILDLTDHCELNELIPQAFIDTEGFKMFELERYNDEKKKLVHISNQFEALQTKLSQELIAKEEAEKMLRSKIDEKTTSDAMFQIRASNTKMKEISINLWSAVGALIESERKVLKHLGGCLRWKLQDHSQTMSEAMSEAPTLKQPKSHTSEQKMLASAEERIRELNAQVNVLKSSISKMENKKDAEVSKEGRISAKQPTAIEFNKLKLDYATGKAELGTIKEELNAFKSNVSILQLQLDKNQSILQNKDREISNLLYELEEVTKRAEFTNAGERLTNEQRSPVNSLSEEMNGSEFSSNLNSSSLVSPISRPPPPQRVVNYDLEKRVKELEIELIESKGSKNDEMMGKLSKVQKTIEKCLQVKESKTDISTVDKLTAEVASILASAQVSFKNSENECADLRQKLVSYSKEDEDFKTSMANIQSGIEVCLNLEKNPYSESEIVCIIRKLIDHTNLLERKLQNQTSEFTDLKNSLSATLEQEEKVKAKLKERNQSLKEQIKTLEQLSTSEPKNNLNSAAKDLEVQKERMASEKLYYENSTLLQNLKKALEEITELKNATKNYQELVDKITKYTTEIKEANAQIESYKKAIDEKEGLILSKDEVFYNLI